MSFDISRSTFHPRKNFLGVVMQQGRVQLDSDWNEWQSEFSRRTQAGTLDTVGQAVYPASTPNAFKITAATDANGAPTLTIGAGRYYVDGLLAENHGPESQQTWDPSLAELSGAPAFSNTSASTDYAQQPYFPNPPLPDGDGPFLAYLDVWQRDVTYLEDPDLIDKAINIDTTGRLQTVWQVKLLNLANSPNADCSTDIPGFDTLLAPPAARLTNGLVPNAGTGPCCLAPNTGYTGQENQLYRVEIHQPGAPGTATFKWSRDNASVETNVSAIATVTTTGTVSQLTVASLGRDQVLSFRVNDWIEITDDAYELNGQPGELFQITAVNSASRTLTLNAAVSAHFSAQPDPKLHTRIRRWDQSGKVFQTDSSGNTTLWTDLNVIGTGQIPVPPAGTTLVLENGITVAFDLIQQTGADFRTADYWTFAARTADGSVEIITEAPPLGIHHHYARLSIVTFPSTATDCRIAWPPTESETGCCCTVNISPTDIKSDTTLQAILDKYQNLSTPITICLETGTYSLPAPLRLTSAHSNITIQACQPGAATIQALQDNEAQFNDGLIVLDNSTNITFTGIKFLIPLSPFAPTSFAGLSFDALPAAIASQAKGLLVSIGIRILSGTGISITQCSFKLANSTSKVSPKLSSFLGAAIFLNGQSDSLHIEDNQFSQSSVRFLRTAGLFSTGLLLAPSVSFTPPSVVQTAPAPITFQPAPPVVTTTTVQPKARKVTAKAVATTDTQASTQTAATSTFTVTESLINKIEDTGVQIVGGLLQNLGGLASSSPATLASQGGQVLAATLDNSTLRNNTFTRLTTAAVLFGQPGSLTTSANTITLCSAGIWIVTPLETQQILSDPQNLLLLGAIAALSYPLPQTISSPTPIAAAPDSTRIYAGTSQYNDGKNLWLPDTAAKNVTISGGSLNHVATTQAISGTADATLYQSERYGTFSYTFNSLPPGYYALTLKFAEIFDKTKGERIFNVTVNGAPALTNFEILADAAFDTADDKTFTGIAPNSAGQIVVQFTGTTEGTDSNAKVNAVELDPTWTGTPYLGAGAESDTANFFDQLAQLSMQAYAATGSPVTQLRAQDNDFHNLTAPGFLLLADDSPFNTNTSSLTFTGNRLEGEIPEPVNTASFVGRFIPNAFYYLVVVLNATRAVVSANQAFNGTPSDGYGPSLYLNDSTLATPAIAVMSNVLARSPLILPTRPIFDTSLDSSVQSWNFLNTILT